MAAAEPAGAGLRSEFRPGFRLGAGGRWGAAGWEEAEPAGGAAAAGRTVAPGADAAGPSPGRATAVAAGLRPGVAGGAGAGVAGADAPLPRPAAAGPVAAPGRPAVGGLSAAGAETLEPGGGVGTAAAAPAEPVPLGAAAAPAAVGLGAADPGAGCSDPFGPSDVAAAAGMSEPAVPAAGAAGSELVVPRGVVLRGVVSAAGGALARPWAAGVAVLVALPARSAGGESPAWARAPGIGSSSASSRVAALVRNRAVRGWGEGMGRVSSPSPRRTSPGS